MKLLCCLRSGLVSLVCGLLLVVGLVPVSSAQPASAAASAPAPASASTFRIRAVDDAWRAALPRDPVAATQAYMDRLPADVVARSNAYFEGRNWLQLWNWLAGLAVSA